MAETGFLTPSSVWLGDVSEGSLKPGKTQKALFDGSHDVVEQLQATSKDGTKVPYFVVHRKDMPFVKGEMKGNHQGGGRGNQ